MNFFIKDNLAQNQFANIVISHIYYTFIKSAMKNIRVSRLSFILLLFFLEMPKTKPTNLSKNKLSNEHPTPKKRKSLTAAQKREICLKKKSSPFLKNKDLAKEYDVSEGMVCDI
jgi:hypothetical protein